MAYRAKSAGSSLRRARSPDAPKMISVNGSSTDGMAPKGAPERGEHAIGEGVLAARPEPREQGCGDGGGRYGLFHGVGDRPPPFAGVLHPGTNLGQLGIGSEHVGAQLQQP